MMLLIRNPLVPIKIGHLLVKCDRHFLAIDNPYTYQTSDDDTHGKKHLLIVHILSTL